MAALGAVQMGGESVTVGQISLGQSKFHEAPDYTWTHSRYSGVQCSGSTAATFAKPPRSTCEFAGKSPLLEHCCGYGDRDVVTVQDLGKHVAVLTNGPDLTNYPTCTQTRRYRSPVTWKCPLKGNHLVGRLDQQQAASGIAFYTREEKSMQKRLDTATRDLGRYVKKHHIAFTNGRAVSV